MLDSVSRPSIGMVAFSFIRNDSSVGRGVEWRKKEAKVEKEEDEEEVEAVERREVRTQETSLIILQSHSPVHLLSVPHLSTPS